MHNVSLEVLWFIWSAAGVIADQVLVQQQKSRAFYRIQATRMMIGAGNILKKHAADQARKVHTHTHTHAYVHTHKHKHTHTHTHTHKHTHTHPHKHTHTHTHTQTNTQSIV